MSGLSAVTGRTRRDGTLTSFTWMGFTLVQAVPAILFPEKKNSVAATIELELGIRARVNAAAIHAQPRRECAVALRWWCAYRNTPSSNDKRVLHPPRALPTKAEAKAKGPTADSRGEVPRSADTCAHTRNLIVPRL